jgi:hypothetical protein
MSSAIPRFLLPQRSSIWRSRAISPSRTTQIIRNASHKTPPKAKTTPITPKVPILEKPAKFNPPSHGSKLPKARPQYTGPPLSEAQRAAQKTKRYPHTMPNEGTFVHWFLNNRSIHTYITLVLSLNIQLSCNINANDIYPGHSFLPSRLRNHHQFQANL